VLISQTDISVAANYFVLFDVVRVLKEMSEDCREERENSKMFEDGMVKN